MCGNSTCAQGRHGFVISTLAEPHWLCAMHSTYVLWVAIYLFSRTHRVSRGQYQTRATFVLPVSLGATKTCPQTQLGAPSTTDGESSVVKPWLLLFAVEHWRVLLRRASSQLLPSSCSVATQRRTLSMRTYVFALITSAVNLTLRSSKYRNQRIFKSAAPGITSI